MTFRKTQFFKKSEKNSTIKAPINVDAPIKAPKYTPIQSLNKKSQEKYSAICDVSRFLINVFLKDRIKFWNDSSQEIAKSSLFNNLRFEKQFISWIHEIIKSLDLETHLLYGAAYIFAIYTSHSIYPEFLSNRAKGIPNTFSYRQFRNCAIYSFEQLQLAFGTCLWVTDKLCQDGDLRYCGKIWNQILGIDSTPMIRVEMDIFKTFYYNVAISTEDWDNFSQMVKYTCKCIVRKASKIMPNLQISYSVVS